MMTSSSSSNSSSKFCHRRVGYGYDADLRTITALSTDTGWIPSSRIRHFTAAGVTTSKISSLRKQLECIRRAGLQAYHDGRLLRISLAKARPRVVYSFVKTRTGRVRSPSFGCFYPRIPLPTPSTVLCFLSCHSVQFFIFQLLS